MENTMFYAVYSFMENHFRSLIFSPNPMIDQFKNRPNLLFALRRDIHYNRNEQKIILRLSYDTILLATMFCLFLRLSSAQCSNYQCYSWKLIERVNCSHCQTTLACEKKFRTGTKDKNNREHRINSNFGKCDDSAYKYAFAGQRRCLYNRVIGLTLTFASKYVYFRNIISIHFPSLVWLESRG